jgi:citronellol/citronellal dehydrogenase
MRSLDGAVAVVTGASRGIGKALAIGLAAEGAKVVCAARSSDRRAGELPGTVERTAMAIEESGGTALPVRCDIGVPSDISRLIDVTLKTWKRVDVLVNNAMTPTRDLWRDVSLESWDLSMRVNVRSLFVMAKAACPVMEEVGGGSIINISSGAADPRVRGVPPGYLTYSVAKAALERFTTALAEEVADSGIAVNALRPGAVKTETSVHELGEDFDWSGWSQPDAVVPAVVYLAKQRSDGITGRILDSTHYGISWPEAPD